MNKNSDGSSGIAIGSHSHGGGIGRWSGAAPRGAVASDFGRSPIAFDAGEDEGDLVQPAANARRMAASQPMGGKLRMGLRLNPR
jgi:hypothetical protein